MRALLERFRPRGGLTPHEAVPSELASAESEVDAAFFVSRLKAALTLFVWLVTLILAGLGSIQHASMDSVGRLVALGSIVLSVGVTLLIVAPRRSLVTKIIPFGCFLYLLSALQFTGNVHAERSVLLDRELVLLLTVPVVFRLLSWQTQAAAGVLAIISLELRTTLFS